jgi:hypothetical protein
VERIGLAHREKLKERKINMKLQNLTLILIVIICFGLLPKAHSVSPQPDGGYAGGNTAEGQNALLSLTTGIYNTAVGSFSLLSNTDGNFNTGVGAGTLLVNTADQNTATGAGALLSNTIGFRNTANGTFALFNNTEGFDNTATGANALSSNTTGNGNTAAGDIALFFNTTGNVNTATGSEALYSNTDGFGNTATGAGALNLNTTGDGNTAHGYSALANNTTGATNTAVGANALLFVTTGSGNIALGADAGSAITANNDVICIGAPGPASVSDACFIGHIFGTTSSGGTAVFINSDGRLGTQVSSKRFKEEIKPMERSSEALYALKPVTFRYKKEFDPQGILQFGLVAEDVEAVNPDLVVRDKEGKVNTVHYEVINAMLLNEFLKEHRKVEQQQASITELKSAAAKQDAIISELKRGMGVLTAQLKEQAAQIHKVSAQVELNNARPQTVLNDQR